MATLVPVAITSYGFLGDAATSAFAILEADACKRRPECHRSKGHLARIVTEARYPWLGALCHSVLRSSRWSGAGPPLRESRVVAVLALLSAYFSMLFNALFFSDASLTPTFLGYSTHAYHPG